jgi:hypothetical protein
MLGRFGAASGFAPGKAPDGLKMSGAAGSPADLGSADFAGGGVSGLAAAVGGS